MLHVNGIGAGRFLNLEVPGIGLPAFASHGHILAFLGNNLNSLPGCKRNRASADRYIHRDIVKTQIDGRAAAIEKMGRLVVFDFHSLLSYYISPSAELSFTWFDRERDNLTLFSFDSCMNIAQRVLVSSSRRLWHSSRRCPSWLRSCLR